MENHPKRVAIDLPGMYQAGQCGKERINPSMTIDRAEVKKEAPGPVCPSCRSGQVFESIGQGLKLRRIQARILRPKGITLAAGIAQHDICRVDTASLETRGELMPPAGFGLDLFRLRPGISKIRQPRYPEFLF